MTPAENFRVLVRQKKASFEEGKWYSIRSGLGERWLIKLTDVSIGQQVLPFVVMLYMAVFFPGGSS